MNGLSALTGGFPNPHQHPHQQRPHSFNGALTPFGFPPMPNMNRLLSAGNGMDGASFSSSSVSSRNMCCHWNMSNFFIRHLIKCVYIIYSWLFRWWLCHMDLTVGHKSIKPQAPQKLDRAVYGKQRKPYKIQEAEWKKWQSDTISENVRILLNVNRICAQANTRNVKISSIWKKVSYNWTLIIDEEC